MCLSSEPRVMMTNKRQRAMAQMSSQIAEAPKDELLQACLRYDWDKVAKWCHILASCKNNDTVIRQQLLQQDAWGNTPLHAACHYNPPLTIVYGILQLAKQTGIRRQLCNMPNANGAVPAVVVCLAGGASMPVLMLLVRDLEQQHNNNQHHPLLCDSKGHSAIAGLVDRYQMLRKVPKFAHSMRALKDITSIHSSSCWNHNNNNIPQEEEEANEHPQSGGNDNNNNNMLHLIVDDMTMGGFDQCWNKIQVLLETTWKLDFGSLEGWTPLHGAAHVADQIPPELSELLIRCYPSELVMVSSSSTTTPSSSVNNAGRLLPLHLAIDNGAAIFVQQLINADSSTASVPHPTTGQLPMVQAIGKFSWNVRDIISNNKNANNMDNDNEEAIISQGILQQLWKAYPEALDVPDAQTKLYPALLAATVPETDDQLDTIFNMLRLNPSIVAK